MNKIYFTFLIFLLNLSPAFSQVRAVQWKDLPNKKGHVFPLATIEGNSEAEKEINSYLQERYLNHDEAKRDIFYEYEGLTPTANVSGISISYEHEFNTAPGIMSFNDLHFFDLANGQKIKLGQLLDEHEKERFLALVNERKNNFVNQYKTTITKDREDYNKLLEIVQYTLNDKVNLKKIMDEYELVFTNEGILIKKNWDYAWGAGRHDLPYINFNVSYEELKPFLNDKGKRLLITPKTITENKLFYGFIGGKYKISALVREKNDSIKITYWYESNKVPINWSGQIENEVYTLAEMDDNKNQRAKITMTFNRVDDKVKAIGEWYDLKNNKKLTIELFEH